MTSTVRRAIILNDQARVTGGASAVALAEARGLARRGLEVTLLAAAGPPAADLADEPNLRVVCLNQPEIAQNPRRLAAFSSGLRNGAALRALRRILAECSPADTRVHVHSWTKALSPFVIAEAARRRFPVVVTLHDFFLACPNGGFFVYPRGELCGRRPLSGACWTCRCDRRNSAHKLWRGLRTWIQNGVLRVPGRISAYVAVSQFSLNLLRPYLPSGTAARVLRNPVDAPDEGPAPVSRQRPFCFVGRVEVEKGARLFAEAVRLARVPATIIGDGALLPELKRLLPEARFTGWLDGDDLRREVRGARALVFPPLWHETLGLVVIEAAAAGVPAVVSNRSAATEHIRDGENGLHFERGSPEALAAQLRALAGDDTLTDRLGRSAYSWYWKDPWTTQSHISGLMDVYESLGGIGTRN